MRVGLEEGGWVHLRCAPADSRAFVRSVLQEQLHDHFNAEVVGGSIASRQDAVDFLSWTYFYRRLTRNPTYYHVPSLPHAWPQ